MIEFNEYDEIKMCVPQRFVKEQKTIENSYAHNSYDVVWIDLEKAVGEKNYGCWFPAWKMSCENTNGLYTPLTIDKYRYNTKGERIENTFVVEHKEKIKGKKFKRFNYSAEEFAALLGVFQEEITAIKESRSKLSLAFVDGHTYAVGFIYKNTLYLPCNITKKAGQFSIIAENLSESDCYEINKALDNIRQLEESKTYFQKRLSESKPYHTIEDKSHYTKDTLKHNGYIINRYGKAHDERVKTFVALYETTINNITDEINALRNRLDEWGATAKE